jgi:hypothetical protein
MRIHIFVFPGLVYNAWYHNKGLSYTDNAFHFFGYLVKYF